jgi:hypothetical protein
MKNRNYIKYFNLSLIILMIACVDDSQHGPYGSDNIDPGLVVVNEVVNTPDEKGIFFSSCPLELLEFNL